MSGSLDRLGKLLLVTEADSGVFATLDAIVIIKEALEKRCIFVVDLFDPQFAEETTLFLEDRHQ